MPKFVNQLLHNYYKIYRVYSQHIIENMYLCHLFHRTLFPKTVFFNILKKVPSSAPFLIYL